MDRGIKGRKTSAYLRGLIRDPDVKAVFVNVFESDLGADSAPRPIYNAPQAPSVSARETAMTPTITGNVIVAIAADTRTNARRKRAWSSCHLE